MTYKGSYSIFVQFFFASILVHVIEIIENTFFLAVLAVFYLTSKQMTRLYDIMIISNTRNSEHQAFITQTNDDL